jgi:hypothetical protein
MAAGNTYTQIASTTLGSAASSVTFSSIAGTYTDLVLVFNGTGTAGTTAALQFNSDTGSNYSNTYVLGDGTSASSGRASSLTSTYLFYPATTIGTATINIMNYSNATTFKTALCRWSTTGNYALASVGLWRGTIAAINSVTVLTVSSTFAAGSTFNLYGITAA